MAWYIPLIKEGLSLFDNWFGSNSRRKDKELNLKIWEAQQKWQMEKQERFQLMEHKEREHRVKMFEQAIKIVEHISRTNIELAILTEQTHDERYKMFNNWLVAKQKEIATFRNDLLKGLHSNFELAKSLDGETAKIFHARATQIFDDTYNSIMQIETTTRREITDRCKQNAIEYTPLPMLNEAEIKQKFLK